MIKYFTGMFIGSVLLGIVLSVIIVRNDLGIFASTATGAGLGLVAGLIGYVLFEKSEENSTNEIEE